MQSSVSIEVVSPEGVLRAAERLEDFKIWDGERIEWHGSAVINSIVDLGVGYACEVALDEEPSNPSHSGADEHVAAEHAIRAVFHNGLRRMTDFHRVPPEFKVVVHDFALLFDVVRTELERIELTFTALSANEREEAERNLTRGLLETFGDRANDIVERFENTVELLDADQRRACRQVFHALLHPVLMCAPFAYRCFTKPLGYAGDYEMVNMILRNGIEGRCLFAKFLNSWLLSQAPARAHRNRVSHLYQRIQEEVLGKCHAREDVRICSLGCGPAGEVQQFLDCGKTASNVKFTLIDFNEETVAFLSKKLEALRLSARSHCLVEVVKKSVNTILQDSLRADRRGRDCPQYELVYCAGLFDYLTDGVCRRLIEILFGWVAPGGLLIVTNVDQTLNSCRCFRNSLEFFLDWNLIYRSSSQLAAIVPNSIPHQLLTLYSENSGVNVFMEIRKSEYQNG